MLRISTKKTWALTQLKFKTMMNANIILAPIFAVFVTGLLRVFYTQISSGDGLPEFMLQILLNIGLTFNIGMTGIFVTSVMLAEEKENCTLRVLMNSSVTATEFFLASIIPPLIIMIGVNMVLLPVSGIAISNVNIPIYFVITTIASITSCIIGMILGVFAKNQVSASTLSVPLLMIITLLPTFSAFIPTLEKISRFLFTGVLTDMVKAYVSKESFMLGGFNVIVLLGEILLSFIIFAAVYRMNGFEKD